MADSLQEKAADYSLRGVALPSVVTLARPQWEEPPPGQEEALQWQAVGFLPLGEALLYWEEALPYWEALS